MTISGPASGIDGVTYAYVLTVANAGPQGATGVVATLTLPAHAVIMALPAECMASGSSVSCSIGTLAADASRLLNFALSWTSPSGMESLAAGVSSDLADPAPGDNATSFQLAFDPASDGDVPTLPEWGLILLASMLGVAVMRQSAPVPR